MSLKALSLNINNAIDSIKETPRIYMSICLFGIFAYEMYDAQPNSDNDKIKSGDKWKWDIKQQLFEIGIGSSFFIYYYYKTYPFIKGKQLTKREIASFISIIFGFILRKYCKIILGKFFTYSVTVKQNHKIIDYGPYGIVRHPSYTGGMFVQFGYAFWFNQPVSYLLFGPFFISFLYTRIPAEEQALIKNTDGQYKEYCKKVKYRLIPYVY